MSITSVSARAAAAMQGSAPGFANTTAGFAAALEKYAKELDRQTRDVAAIAASANACEVKPTPATLHSDGATEIYDVGTGQVALDIDAYFTPPRPGEQVDLNTLPLLMPTENNLRALSQHIAKRLPDALKAYDIPSAPAYVRYDNSGQLVLPDNYPYADKFKA